MEACLGLSIDILGNKGLLQHLRRLFQEVSGNEMNQLLGSHEIEEILPPSKDLSREMRVTRDLVAVARGQCHGTLIALDCACVPV